ncbi:L,D-transpeptidase family protein [Breoghania sp.]|uniref:L,D-transpeptidase family protein n=1 Tax=Breoghania sp. TaxID=2065378 RepID=UPI002AA91891|nr:L,D-transpeptidase family protein [Breoghania sp.]
MAEAAGNSSWNEIRVLTLSAQSRNGVLQFGPLTARCAIGRSGITRHKREGDGASPAGTFRLIEVLYRADRIARPVTSLPVRAIRPADIWCDDPGDGRYNRAAHAPLAASHEKLWRDDHLYDVIVVLDHNRKPRVRGHGSAVFFHLARPGYSPTEGCVAVKLGDMRRLLARAARNTHIRIG